MALQMVFLNETCDRVRVGEHLCDTFPVKNGLEQEVLRMREEPFFSEPAHGTATYRCDDTKCCIIQY